MSVDSWNSREREAVEGEMELTEVVMESGEKSVNKNLFENDPFLPSINDFLKESRDVSRTLTSEFHEFKYR